MCLYCIGKYQIDPSKTVVGVDENEGTIYAYTKALLGTNYLLSSHSCHFVKKQILNQTLHAYVQHVYMV